MFSRLLFPIYLYSNDRAAIGDDWSSDWISSHYKSDCLYGHTGVSCQATGVSTPSRIQAEIKSGRPPTIELIEGL